MNSLDDLLVFRRDKIINRVLRPIAVSRLNVYKHVYKQMYKNVYNIDGVCSCSTLLCGEYLRLADQNLENFQIQG